jgi:phage I-like protein
MNSASATPFFALCAAAALPGFGQAVALNFEGAAPEWIELIPKGPALTGHDGRKFTLSDPAKVVAAYDARGLKLPIDINHAQFLKAPKGEEAPAAGWIEGLEVRDGAVYGRVEWTTAGASALARKKYRYISPALQHSSAGEVLALHGAGLVNSPNFTMPALNAAIQESQMKNVLAKLGLPETASENDAVAKIAELLTSLNARQPDLASFVPRADYELALNARKTAEEALAARNKADHDAEVARLIEDAVKGGKIAPASKAFYLSTCASAEGVAAFRQFVADAPTLFKEAVQPGQDGGAHGVALNAEQLATAEAMGFDEKAFAEFLASQKK